MDMETYCGNNQRSDCTAMTLAGGKEGKICTGDLSCMDDIEKVFKCNMIEAVIRLSGSFNLGNEREISVLELIQTLKRVTNRDFE